MKKHNKHKNSGIAVANFIAWILIIAVAVFIFNMVKGIKDHSDKPVVKKAVITKKIIPAQSPIIARYMNKVEKHDPYIRSLAIDLTKECSGAGFPNECAVEKLYSYVQGDMRYIGDPIADELILEPFQTINSGGGDCEDLSILLVSLLNNIGIKSYLVLVPNHMYALACGINENYFQKFLTKKIINSERIMQDKQYIVFDLSKLTDKNINLKITAVKGVDVFQFATLRDIDMYHQNKNHVFFEHCSGKDVYEFDKDCYITTGNRLYIRSNKNRNSVKVSAELKIEQNIPVYEKDGMSCIVLDPSIRGNGAFPGLESDKYKDVKKQVFKVW